MDATNEASISIIELSLGELRIEYNTIKIELEKKNQELYDCRRLLKTAEALEKDYQQEIEALQNADSIQQQKLKLTVQKLESDLADSKQQSNEHIQYLEAELNVKNDEVKELQDKLKFLSENTAKQDVDTVDVLKDENMKLKNEIGILLERQEILDEESQVVKNHNVALEEQIVILKADVENLNESLKVKRDELAEANHMISTLQDEVAVLRNEMDALKSKPLDKDSKGNSLFAEVNDRRIELQKTIQNMREKYTNMKRDYCNLMKQNSSLRSENMKLRERWELDLVQIGSDEECVLYSLKSRIEALETVVKSYQNEAIETQKLNNDDCKTDFRFLEGLLGKKGKEIEALRQELSSRSLRIMILADDLKAANAQIRKLNTEKIRLEQELESLKDDLQLNTIKKEPLTNDTPQENIVESKTVGKQKSTELPIERYSHNVDFSRLETKKKCSLSMTFENKENVDSTIRIAKTKGEDVNFDTDDAENINKENNEAAEQAKRKVTFLENTPVEKTLLRNGVKVIKSKPIIIKSYK